MRDLLVGRGYGRTVALSGDADSLRAARGALPFWWQDSDDEPELVEHLVHPDAAALKLRTVERWVAEHAVDRVFVHAAAVALGSRVILLPGRSWTGKSTLCAELLRRGATYLSDEYAVLDGEGLVHAYPRPVQLRVGDLRVPTSAASLGAPTAQIPLPVGLLAFLRFDADRGWDVDEVSPGPAVLDLLDNALCARTRTEAAVDAAAAAVANASAIRGTRGEAGQAAEILLGWLS